MVHKFKLNGLNIVLDSNSGGVHAVDDLTYDLLDNVEPPFDAECPQRVLEKLSKSYDEADIKECYNEIVELYNEKILFSEDDYEKYDYIIGMNHENMQNMLRLLGGDKQAKLFKIMRFAGREKGRITPKSPRPDAGTVFAGGDGILCRS